MAQSRVWGGVPVNLARFSTSFSVNVLRLWIYPIKIPFNHPQPQKKPAFSHGFPWFSHKATIFLWFSHCFPMFFGAFVRRPFGPVEATLWDLWVIKVWDSTWKVWAGEKDHTTTNLGGHRKTIGKWWCIGIYIDIYHLVGGLGDFFISIYWE